MIQDLKLRQLFKLQKSIEILNYELLPNGLEIDYYTQDGNMNSLILNAYETCEWLKKSGLILSYDSDSSGNCSVAWETEENTEHNGEHHQTCKTHYGSFADFVEQTRFSTWDAITVAALYELNKIPQNQNTVI